MNSLEVALEEQEEDQITEGSEAISWKIPTPDWLMEDTEKLLVKKAEDDDDNNKENIPPIPPSEQCNSTGFSDKIPLLDYLCAKYKCSLKELQVLFYCLEKRRAIIDHLRYDVILRTGHLRPQGRNFIVRCNDVTVQPVGSVPALNGYLGITVY